MDFFRERERNIDLLSYLFMHSLVASFCMCRDWGSNSQPWSIGMTLTELPGQGLLSSVCVGGWGGVLVFLKHLTFKHFSRFPTRTFSYITTGPWSKPRNSTVTLIQHCCWICRLYAHFAIELLSFLILRKMFNGSFCLIVACITVKTLPWAIACSP